MIKTIKSKKSWIETDVIDKLSNLSKLEGVKKIVALPDIHQGKMPVGVAYLTKDKIYPSFVGNDIGCGMSLYNTFIDKKKFKLKKVIKKLSKIENLRNLETKIDDEIKSLKHLNKFGTIGSGNHFAEFLEIKEIVSNELSNKYKIDKNSMYFLVHSGSRDYLNNYIDGLKYKKLYYEGFDFSSDLYEEYMSYHNNAILYAKLNREEIRRKLFDILNFDKYQKLIDINHNFIERLNIDSNNYFIHRKGANSSDDRLLIIAGSRGSSSYIVRAKKDINLDFNRSIAHGAGRRWSRTSCKDRLENIYRRKDLRELNFNENLICRDKNLYYEEAKEAYKSIKVVIDDMVAFDMIEVIAILKPVLTFKN
ncbi:MAG: RNA ligase RtcB family protein [Peptostreptococcaceae bacterium]|jgi:release factor H-coupled RctB family protein|nr:RNA ligase RtcB family protein [Peptostreptococcaceae bacterium]